MLASLITGADLDELLSALCGLYLLEVAAGRIRIITRPLPGPAVSSILPCVGDGILRVVFDPEKPNAYAHTRQMLREWWQSFQVPEVGPDGEVALTPMALPQEHAERKPYPLAALA